MRRRFGFGILCALLLSLAPLVPAGAALYLCSGPVGVAASGSTVFGPACSLRVTCPVDAAACDVNALATVEGIGIVGVAVRARSSGISASCTEVSSCGIGIANIASLQPGQSTRIDCFFFSESVAAAALVRVDCQADVLLT